MRGGGGGVYGGSWSYFSLGLMCSDILVVGLDILPWRPGPTETFNLPSFTKSDCTVPDLPIKWRDGSSYVGGLTAEGPMICGYIKQQSSCYRLASNGTWEGVGGMRMTLRQHAAAVRLEDGWWVTGLCNFSFWLSIKYHKKGLKTVI